ncbi:hypothetical protein [Nocardia sp. NPDC003963]
MTHESPEYSGANLRPTVWGEVTESTDGYWETVWRLGFTGPQPRRSLLVQANDESGFRATLETDGSADGVLRVRTRADAMSAVYYPLTFTSFAVVNDTVGEIREIQGLPRDWYAPFRDRGRE